MRSHRYANPADDPEAVPFLRGIADKPGEHLRRLVFADWLDENGYTNAAAGQRWAAKHGHTNLPHRPQYDVVPIGNGFAYDITRNDDGATLFLQGDDAEHLQRELGHGGRADDVLSGYDNLFEPAAKPEQYHRQHEKDFLGTSHSMSWHPETGEPLPPEARD